MSFFLVLLTIVFASFGFICGYHGARVYRDNQTAPYRNNQTAPIESIETDWFFRHSPPPARDINMENTGVGPLTPIFSYTVGFDESDGEHEIAPRRVVVPPAARIYRPSCSATGPCVVRILRPTALSPGWVRPTIPLRLPTPPAPEDTRGAIESPAPVASIEEINVPAVSRPVEQPPAPTVPTTPVVSAAPTVSLQEILKYDPDPNYYYETWKYASDTETEDSPMITKGKAVPAVSKPPLVSLKDILRYEPDPDYHYETWSYAEESDTEDS